MAGNQSDHQNFVQSLISKNLWLIFIEAKTIFLKKKVQNGKGHQCSLYHGNPLLKKFNHPVLGFKTLDFQPLVSEKMWGRFSSFWLCLMSMVYTDPKFLIYDFWYLTIQSDTINTIKHNGTKKMFLISVLYQNASTSRILDPSPQGLIYSEI